MQKIKTYILLMITFAFIACEKTIDIDYKSNQSTIVIEGNITDEAGPYHVKLTRSVALAETGAVPTIDNAVVTIADNAGNSETLTAQGQGVYRTGLLQGVAGRTYRLTVQADGNTYTAQSTMPSRVAFDSIKIEEVLFGGEIERNLIPVYTDPVAGGNYYRFLFTINNKLVQQHYIQNDEIRNGVVNSFPLQVNDDDLKLKPGDNVRVTMQCVDRNAGLYYTTLALMTDNGPGGGTTPNNPPTNILNGALGLFSAHSSETKMKLIQ